MADSELVSCPYCQEMVRVPEALYGQAVKCPRCRRVFLGPQLLDGIMTGPTTIQERRSLPVDINNKAFNPMPPGIVLLLVGILALVVNGVSLGQLIFAPDAFRENLRNSNIAVKKLTGQAEPDAAQVDKEIDDNLTMYRAIVVVCFSMGLLTAAGGAAMILRRGYWLAVVGSFIAMINLSNLCCCLGAPVGIWSLIVLFNPYTKGLFTGRLMPTELPNELS